MTKHFWTVVVMETALAIFDGISVNARTRRIQFQTKRKHISVDAGSWRNPITYITDFAGILRCLTIPIEKSYNLKQ